MPTNALWIVAVDMHMYMHIDLLSIGPSGTNLNEMVMKTIIFIQENVFETVLCRMFVILLKPQSINDVGTK